MDRFFPRLILLVLAAVPTFAQNPSPSPSPGTDTKPSEQSDLRAAAPAQQEEAGRRFQQMSPEQREKIRKNLQRWKAMSQEERQALRLLAQKRRERLEQSVDEFVQRNGWTLDPERRKQLIERFAQERRTIEETLRKEMEEKRRPMLREMSEKLKAEFAPAAVSPTPSPSPAATQIPQSSGG